MRNPEEIFAARVPRYTSYPTAPHFHAGVDAAVYRGWLEALDPAAPLSLYVHIPFCDTLCWFCGCHTRVVNTYSPLAGYLDLLLREIGLVADALGARRRVTHIHWGGGSPTMLRPADMRRLNAFLRERFDVAPDAEFAIEIDPRGFTPELSRALADIGVTRASIGVQDFDPAVQRAINRIQDFETTAKCVSLLRGDGIDKLSIDLIYGLPHQTAEGLWNTIDQVLTLDPDRLAIFGYAHVPGFKKHQELIPQSALPGLKERFAQAEAAREQLLAAGYVAVGLDHFAKPGDPMAVAKAEGTLARNFQGYTTDTAPALIGFGASSIGSLPQGYVQNLTDVPAWRAALLKVELPVARGVALTEEDRIRREVIERLMCDLEVDLAAVARRYGRAPAMFADALADLQSQARDGIVQVDGWYVRVPDAWRPAIRIVCAAFDTYLSKAGTHSVAV
ncbi:MAG: oxygen-independent coproporphyrinogen III oxidase [Rhizomicrobium sp.]